MKRRWVNRSTCVWLALLVSLVLAVPVAAGPLQQAGGVYVVEAGDTLYSIALQFDLTVEELLAANGLDDPDTIYAGQELVIPTAGQSVETPAPAVGSEDEEAVSDTQTYVVQPGDTLFGIAASLGLTVEDLMETNGISEPDYLYVGQVLTIPGSGLPASYPVPFESIELSPGRSVVQGQTLVVKVELSQPAKIVGEFDGRRVPFVSSGQSAWAVLGIHALQETGLYSLLLRATGDGGAQAAAVVGFQVGPGSFSSENIDILPDRENLLDEELMQTEYERLANVWSQVSPYPLWEGPYILPLTTSEITSFFGTRRSYEDGTIGGFHTGVDFRGAEGTPIYAPATGKIAFTGELNVRGGSTLIDHGLGVYSGFWHQSEILVEPGQMVEPGQLIGYVGNTGLSTGPHLHWEIRVAGIAVDPMEWTTISIP